MTTEQLCDEFRIADLQGLPPIEVAGDDARLLTFWVLLVGKEALNLHVMTPGEISAVLRDVYGWDVPRQRVASILQSERGFVSRRRKGGKQAFQLMQPGIVEVRGVTPTAVFVDPSKAVQRIRDIEDSFRELKGTVSICDPYVDPTTLTYIAECVSADEVRLLTVQISRGAAFSRNLKALRKQLKIPIEVRVLPKGVLHDRYVIHHSGMLLIGTSLNGLGLKQSFIVSLGEDLRNSMLAEYDSLWINQASTYP